jgi:formyl-CoA transferase
MNGALAGVLVLDFSEYIAGPYAGQALADLGADVVKVEPPLGDFWRHTNSIAPNESRGFIGVNRGKRSISLDLKHPGSRPVLERAVRKADVLLHNYRPGVAERLGVGYEQVSALNPRLIYCENSAFGRTGPYAGLAGYDLVASAMTGIMAFEGGGGPPRPIITLAVTDLSAGLFMALAIASALYQRERTGRGQRLETSLFAAGLAIQYRPMLSIEHLDREPREELLASLRRGREEGRSFEEVLAEHRSRRAILTGGSGPYYKVYETMDSYVVIACLNNRLRRAAAEALGVDDPRIRTEHFDLRGLSLEEQERLNERIADIFRTRTTAEWCDLFQSRGVPCGPVRLNAELFDDPHAAANGLIVTLDHPVVGPIRMADSPVKMSDAETGAKTAAPALGQHTRDFLGELGFSAEEVRALEEDRVVRGWDPA